MGEIDKIDNMQRDDHSVYCNGICIGGHVYDSYRNHLCTLLQGDD
jgi:hypothetical protein